MGPKGFRICWLGRSRERMEAMFPDGKEPLGELHFLAYPGADQDELKKIYPSFFVVDTEDLHGYRRDLFKWISACREASPSGKVLLLTHNGSVRHSSDALRRGVDWILPIADDKYAMQFSIRSLILLQKAEKEVNVLSREMIQNSSFEGMIGKTPLINDLFRLILKCASSCANVLIRGESGTGKELVARALHRHSGRKGNLVVVNCASVMDSLHQSELFGHERGAFTDAKTRRAGYFEAARGGTLFLDEIGDISPQTQVALLRVIEGMEFFRVGGWEPLNVDVRVISATNRNLEEMVRKGEFREDLYYRLNGFSLTVPPLRERKEDIPLLANAFLKRYIARERKPVTGFTEKTLDLLSTYQWPGNIRELENEVQRLVINVDSERVVASDMLVPPINILKNLPSYRFPGRSPLKERVQQAEAHFIKEELKHHYGNRTRTAEHLGISREGLHKKMSRYQIR